MASASYSYPEIAWFVAGVLCSITVPLSLYPIARHMQRWRKPHLQRYVVRILWMVGGRVQCLVRDAEPDAHSSG